MIGSYLKKSQLYIQSLGSTTLFLNMNINSDTLVRSNVSIFSLLKESSSEDRISTMSITTF